MAFSSKKSWRLRFIDIDSSFTLIPSEDPLIGYIVARAPKGQTRPTYFPRNSGQAIDALMGVASAHWPDLYEAKFYNDEYPIYISAPSGTSEAYPSHIGGFYLTKMGIYKFYNITDKYELEDNIGNAYKVAVEAGREHMFSREFLPMSSRTKIIIQSPLVDDYIPAEDVPGFGIFEFRNDPNVTAIILEKHRRLNVIDLDWDPMIRGIVSPVGTKKSFWGDNDNPVGWVFSGNTATLENFGFKYGGDITEPPNPIRDWIGQDNFDMFFGEEVPNLEGFVTLLSQGFYVDPIDETLFTIPFALQELITFLVSIRNETYAYFMQKGATEKQTNIKISMVGYDKYRYDRIFSYATYNKNEYEETGRLVIDLPPGLVGDDLDEVFANMARNDFVVFYDEDKPDRIAFIGEYTESEDVGDPPYYKPVTANFVTQIITCQDPVFGDENLNLHHRLFNIEGPTTIRHLLTEEENILLYGLGDGPNAYVRGFASGISAPKNIWFNALTLANAEEVYAGRVTSGGEFTGSLDEMGVDSFGGGIYWPEILPDDAMAFLEVRVLKKFGDDLDDLDETGFWNHRRILDPFDIDRSGDAMTERNFSIEGDRYCTLLMTMNLLEQRTGGIWRNEFTQIIMEGLIEATKTDYDDAYIFMEPTGQELFKVQLSNINRAHEFACVISPKILVPNNRQVITEQIADRTVVNGRIATRSNAQYAGEFEVYDPVVFKKYWRQPIGDIACNIVRIIERRYGGWAPAWYNIAGDLGGQLKGTVLKAKYTFDDEATRILDRKGINPISYTSDDGLMILSQKTTQDPNFLSDWSYLGHSLSFDLVKREIRDNVMRPQIMKPINDYWMSLRQAQVENILAKRTGGSSPIWAWATCDIEGQNTQLTRAQRNFVIKVDLRVNVFSETVTLILENHAQIDS